MTEGSTYNSDPRSDEQLVAASRQGDEAAFELLVERYQQELLSFLIRFLRRRAAAEDIFQETFLQVYLSSDGFDITKRFKPWLFTIAANKARDYLRKNKRRATVPLSATVGSGDDGPEFVDLMESNVPMPDKVAADSEQQKLVRDVVDAMPDHLREVMLLSYFNRFAYKEIADMLSIPLGTVKSRLHSAVGTFAQLWKSRYEESDIS